MYISPPLDSFTDEAVYPPQTVEEEQERLRSLGRTASLDTEAYSADEKKTDLVLSVEEV